MGSFRSYNCFSILNLIIIWLSPYICYEFIFQITFILNFLHFHAVQLQQKILRFLEFPKIFQNLK